MIIIMKEYLERSGLVIHWIGFVLSIYFLIELLSLPSPDDLRMSFFEYWQDAKEIYFLAFSSLPLTIGIRYAITGKNYLFPFNKKPLEKPIDKGKALAVLIPFCLLLVYLIFNIVHTHSRF